MITGLQHMGLVVADVEASKRFYGAALGMEEVPRPSSFRFAGAWLRAGGDEIHLIARADTTQADPPQEPGEGLGGGLATHLAFEVDDLAADLERIARLGVVPAAGPLRRGDGVLQAYLRDPDGYVVELFQTTGEEQAGTVRGAVRA
jgi:catechol 2,3-dioxygenase-like lactoylglutathione lyase family enzyme